MMKNNYLLLVALSITTLTCATICKADDGDLRTNMPIPEHQTVSEFVHGLETKGGRGPWLALSLDTSQNNVPKPNLAYAIAIENNLEDAMREANKNCQEADGRACKVASVTQQCLGYSINADDDYCIAIGDSLSEMPDKVSQLCPDHTLVATKCAV